MNLLAVVINVHTDAAASLAVASLRRHAPAWPVHLLNCDPPSESRQWFQQLSERLAFDVSEAPVCPHGEALDRVFRETSADVLLLLDSDAEVLSPEVVRRSLAAFDNEQVFGAGFTDGPAWAGPEVGATATSGAVYFQERPWMPFAMFRVSMVRSALDDGLSFKTKKVWNDFRFHDRVSAALAARYQDEFVPSARYVARLPKVLQRRIATWPIRSLDWARRDFHGTKPSYVLYDTGAEIFQWCKHVRGWWFAGYPEGLNREVAHYLGLTRAVLGDQHRAAEPTTTERDIRARLSSEYDIDFVGP